MNGEASGFAARARRSRWRQTTVATAERRVATMPHPGTARPPAFRTARRTRLGWPRATLPLLLGAALSCNARVDSIDLAAVQHDLQTIRNTEHRALATRNLDAAYAPYAPDWTLLEMDGTRFTLPEERTMTERLFHHLTGFRGATTIESVRALDHGIVLAFDRSEVEMVRGLIQDQELRRSPSSHRVEVVSRVLAVESVADVLNERGFGRRVGRARHSSRVRLVRREPHLVHQVAEVLEHLVEEQAESLERFCERPRIARQRREPAERAGFLRPKSWTRPWKARIYALR